tara:strand:- start:586 stop:1233 length:648 start_codon:yes stop_codon:yes gene_type:complete
MLNQFKNPENQTPCFVIHNVFTPERCQEIIDQYKNNVSKASHDDGKGGLTSAEDNIRSSQIAWINDPDINNTLKNMMTISNHSAGWSYDITSHEQHQFTKYEPNDHYSWHYDGSGCNFSKRHFTFGTPNSLLEVAIPGCIGTVRKISASVLLNDDYSGGEFDAAFIEDGELIKKEIKPKIGDAIFFPSAMTHRVRPVKVGTRYSLVCWFAGPPFK